MENVHNFISDKVMLNAYPDSIGGNLSDMLEILKDERMKDVFSSFYLLPSFFNSDLDRGFSVIDYNINENYASWQDLETLKDIGIDLKLDFILNHLSVLSTQFQDILKNGKESIYKDFFINWNDFWQGHGNMGSDGVIAPNHELIKNMFFRKVGLPILKVKMPNGEMIPYWNTFYQEVIYPKLDPYLLVSELGIQYVTAFEITSIINKQLQNNVNLKDLDFGKYKKYRSDILEYLERHCAYLGQMDLNIKSSKVWEFYENTVKTLASYGAKLIRLDAFAYAPKEVGSHNFMNDPDTWELLSKIQILADKYKVTLLPEIHASYSDRVFEKLSQKGYMTYDFFLPGLIIDALEYRDGSKLATWAMELTTRNIRTVNMLGCHDGIPVLDLKGLLSDKRIDELIQVIVDRGGLIKNLHGSKKIYYQVNSTYFSALGEVEEKLLLARALQIFMPGKPQVWYLDLFMGKNDYEAVEKNGDSGHKEINRTNISKKDALSALNNITVQKQLQLLHFRNTCPAFGWDAILSIKVNESKIEFVWKNNDCTAILKANLSDYSIQVSEICNGITKIIL